MPPPKKKLDRATSQAQKGLSYESPSIASEKRLKEIISLRVPAGSTRIRDELMSYFSKVSMNEAARLYSKLSNPKDQDYILLSLKVHPSTIPKLIDILRVNSGRETAKPVPDRMADDAIKSEFLSIEDMASSSSKRSTSFEDVFIEDRVSELFAEAAKRGFAFSTPDPETERLMDVDLKLHQATQQFNYSGADLQYLISNFPKPPVNNLGGKSKGYYRILEKFSDNQLYEVSEERVKGLLPSITSYKGPEIIGMPYVDKKEKVIVIRYPTEIKLKTNETKNHVFEIWWFADDQNEFNYLLGFAQAAASYNPSPDAQYFVGGELEAGLRVALGTLMRPLGGDKFLVDQMKLETAAVVTSGVGSGLAKRLASSIKGRPPGGGDVGGDDPRAVGLTAQDRYARLKRPKVMQGRRDLYEDTRREVKDYDPRVLEEARRIRAEELPDLSVNSFRRNVAVVRVKIDGKEKIIGSVNEPGSFHSEEQILKAIEKEVGDLKLPSNRKRVELMEVYSERQPCGERCSKHLNAYFPQAKVYHTVSEEWTAQRAKELMDRWLGTTSASTVSP